MTLFQLRMQDHLFSLKLALFEVVFELKEEFENIDSFDNLDIITGVS